MRKLLPSLASLTLIAACGGTTAPTMPTTVDALAPTSRAPADFFCFEATWSDGSRNSECVRELPHCEQDMNEMRGYTTADARFQGCFEQAQVHCYDASGAPLCFVTAADCETSRRGIPGGLCSPVGASTNGQRPHGQRAASVGRYHCFDVSWPDGRRNSECVAAADECERDMTEMRGYTRPGAQFQGCYVASSVYCYDTDSRALCFTAMADCQTSREIITGGECEQRF